MVNMSRVIILAVGNILRRDDGLGGLAAQKIKERMPAVPVFDGGDAPENYLEKILQDSPETVLIIDAVDFNERPGEVRIFEKGELMHRDFSTHGISLKLAMEYLKNRGVKEIKLIGVQPENTGLGEGLSKEVSRSLDKVISACMNYL
jgi:hydrogenase 3 maturation protease